jgi:hypothetical protein
MLGELLRRFALSLVATVLACGWTPAVADLTPAPGYVGLRYPPEPPGHRHLAGYLLEDVSGQEYGVTLLASGGTRLLLLDRLLSRDEQGRPHWEVVAAAALPPIDQADHLVLGACRVHDKPDREIIAVVQYEDKRVFTRTRRAWRASGKLQRFEPARVDGITCDNEGYER